MDVQRLIRPREELHGTNDTNDRKRSTTKKHILENFVNKYFPLVPLNEILEVMKHKENRNVLPPIRPAVALCRSVLTEWMVQVGEAFGFDNLTVHSSIALLDRVLTQMDVARNRLQLVACCTLLIAAKMDEQEEVIPAVEELNNCTDNAYTPELIVQMETILLNQLRWDVCVVTPAHFLGVYLQCSLSETDTLNGLEIQNLSALRTDLAKSASFFVDMSRQDHAFLEHMPSVIAASSVLLSRKLLKLSPIWNDQLSAVTSYEVKDLASCVDKLWNVYKENFLNNTPGT